MSPIVLDVSLLVAQVLLALDTVYVNAMLLILTFGMREGSTLYFEAALVIALLGFVSTAALARFLLRGEVIE